MTDPRVPATFVDHCLDLARRRPAETAYVWLADGEREEASWTFGELDREARKVAVQLDRRGLAGERALLLYSPGLEFLAAFLGCLYAGVVAVPLNAPLSSPRERRGRATMRAIARHADARVLLTESSRREACEEESAALGAPERIVTDRLPLEAAHGWRPGTIDPETLAFLQYTSGSTGSPKGVEVSHANLIRNAFGHDQRTVFVSWLPMFHDMGLVGNVLQPLFLGVRSVLMAPSAFVQKPVRWLRAMTRYGGTTTGAPNFGYELCVQRVRAEHVEGLDLSAWKVAYNGSEPVRASTLERFAEAFAPVGFRREALYPCYGLAEASLFVTGGVPGKPFVTLAVDAQELEQHRVRRARAEDPPERVRLLVSCGRPWLDQRILVVDPEHATPAPEDSVGEIWIAGGNVARGYRDLPPDEDDPFRGVLASGEGPFLRTGDLGFLREGELFVTGRLKDVLIQAGRNHYPQDIELCAGRSHPFLRVDFAAAFMVEHGDEERLVVVQEVDRRHGRPLERAGSEGEALRAELVGAVRGAIAREHGLRVWEVVLLRHGAIPRTSSGKIRRRACRALWRNGELEELRPVAEVVRTADQA